MIFTETKLKGSFIIELEKNEDDRGFFARTFDKEEFMKKGLKSEFIQSSISVNNKEGTIRGMHFQKKPHEEVKIVRCTKGKIFDVIIDLRKNSKTFKKWFSIELSEKNYKMIYVPKGFAHGFQTLKNNTEVSYCISKQYSSKHLGGIRWDDKVFQIKWPLKVTNISDRDRKFKNFIT